MKITAAMVVIYESIIYAILHKSHNCLLYLKRTKKTKAILNLWGVINPNLSHVYIIFNIYGTYYITLTSVINIVYI